MGNDLTSTPYLWKVDTVGILSETPVWIQQIIYIPALKDDDVLLKQWDENTTLAAGTLYQKTGTITNTNTMTSVGNLPSDIADGYVFEITESNGESGNIGKRLVETAGSTNTVVIQEDNWTNEASVVYNWRTFATVSAIVLKAGATDASPIRIPFEPKGREFPNLLLETIDGGTLYFYLRQG